MSTELAFVGLSVVPPLAGIAIVYGRFVRNISKQVQDSLASVAQVLEFFLMLNECKLRKNHVFH